MAVADSGVLRSLPTGVNRPTAPGECALRPARRGCIAGDGIRSGWANAGLPRPAAIFETPLPQGVQQVESCHDDDGRGRPPRPVGVLRRRTRMPRYGLPDTDRVHRHPGRSRHGRHVEIENTGEQSAFEPISASARFDRQGSGGAALRPRRSSASSTPLRCRVATYRRQRERSFRHALMYFSQSQGVMRPRLSRAAASDSSLRVRLSVSGSRRTRWITSSMNRRRLLR